MDDRPTELPPVKHQNETIRPPIRRRSSWLKWVLVLVVFALLAGGIWYLARPGGDAQTAKSRFGANAPQPVAVASVHTGDMPITNAGLGTVTPISTVTVQSQINGQITEIHFKEGQLVKPGDFLIQIDPRPYQVALEQAEGTLAHDKALLADARLDLARYQTLLAQDSIASQQVDTQKSLVLQYQGSVQTDQGAIDSAKLDLVYCHITSPIGGRVGLQQVNLGNYVTPAETNGLVVITQLQPITVVFTLAEDDIPAIQKRLHAGASLSVTVRDRANQTELGTGTLETIDNQIDTTTGTFKLKAIFQNPDETLFPNQFVNAALLLDTVHDAILVPQAAIQNGAPGTYVYLLKADNTVGVQKITTGASDASNVVVSNGLKPGDQVVVDGADRLKDGAQVIVPAAKPAAGGAETATQPPTSQPPASGQHHRHRPDNGQPPSTQQPAPQP